MLRYHVSLFDALSQRRAQPLLELPGQPATLDVWLRVKAKDRLGVLQQLKTWGGSGGNYRPGAGIPVAGGVRAMLGAGEPLVSPGVFPETLVSDHSPQWCENLALIGHLSKLQQFCDMKANPRSRRSQRSRAFGEEGMGEPSP